MRSSITAAVALAASLLGDVVTASSLPIVDLGYERHQAISFNSTGQFYNFSNIRYAQPPIGELRFAAPVPITKRSNVLNNGSVGHICPQADPAWLAIASEFIPAYLTGQTFNATAAAAGLSNMTAPPPDPRTSEDCLFLDVFSPKKVFSKKVDKSNRGAPVMVWIYGGGYTSGEKSGSGSYDPAGLISASNDSVIFVAMNYRLGALGWLGGPSLQSETVAQPALYDQRLAMVWVQNNIHLFGGDKNRVTVFGESAGGGSIMHQITAYGGTKPAPFQQAIPQSPAWQPLPGSNQNEATYQAFLKALNVTSIAEARKLPSAAVIRANALTTATSLYGTFTYGPLVDGVFTPQLPGLLLNSGAFWKNLTIMVGHNSDEGLLFSSPTINTTEGIAEFLAQGFPDISKATIAYILDTLYPPIFNGSYPYTTNFQRYDLILSESTFTCNTNYLDRAFGNKTYAYEFSVFPGLHGEDIGYTWYNGVTTGSQGLPVNPFIAKAMQQYFTSFAISGKPIAAAKGVPNFPIFGPKSAAVEFGNTGITVVTDPTANARCRWWQKALYY